MSELGPERAGDIDRAPLTRFEADMHYAESYFDLYNAFTTFLERQFEIPDEVAMQVYSEVSKQLPDADLFEADAGLAQQQMRLGLVRVALPIAENMFGLHDEFGAWVRDLSRVAMGSPDGVHTVDDCAAAPRGVTEFSCDNGGNCPVKVVKHELIVDSMMPDFQSLDYQGEFANEKIQRTIAKLNAAGWLGLVFGHEASTIRNSYLLRTKAHAPFTPENGDI